ncbi:MAG TPA: DUF885 family protein, partial [Elusimicrobiales bacterium]|nr:DUF885 family protein [Elusimicrobiales bacterium]
MNKKIVLSCIVSLCAFLQVNCFADESFGTFNAEGILEASKLSDSLSKYLPALKSLNPEKYTAFGCKDKENQLTARNQSNITGQIALAKKHLSKINKIRVKYLAVQDYYDYLLFKNYLEFEIYKLSNFSPLENPFYYLKPIEYAYRLIHRSTGNYHRRLEYALSIMQEIPEVLNNAEKYLKLLPEPIVKYAVMQSEDGKDTLDELKSYFDELLSLGVTTLDTINFTIADAKSALNKYALFLKTRVAPLPNKDLSIGKKAYDYYLKHHHITDLTSGRILKITKNEFYSAKKEFLKELSEFLKAKKVTLKDYEKALLKFSEGYPEAEGLLTVFADEMQNAYRHFAKNLGFNAPEELIKILKTPGYKKNTPDFISFSGPYNLDKDKNSEIYINVPSQKLKESERKTIVRREFNYPNIKLAVINLVMPGKF